MGENRIKKLGELLKSACTLPEDQIYISHREKRLTAPGENYGSLMLAVEIELENTQTGQKEILNAVAKLIPPNEFLQQVFNVQVSFPNEIGFYKTIVPYLQQFQRDQGSEEVLDCFPKFYGGRLNLNPGSTVVDQDAVLLLENLADSGYDVGNRYVGFDLETTEVLLKNLAQFHAIPIAIKLLKPEEFERDLLQLFFKERQMLFPQNEELDRKSFERLIQMIKDDDLCMSHSKRIEELFYDSIKFFHSVKNCRDDIHQPFATFVHTDLWVNNIMLKTGAGKKIQEKIIDFQLYEYSSPARDVLFFLYSSVEMKIIEEKYDYFVKFYYDHLMQNLENLKCSQEVFSFEVFQNEIKREGVSLEFIHSLMMVNPIMAYKGSVGEMEDLKHENMFEEISSKQKEKSTFIVREFIKRNLI